MNPIKKLRAEHNAKEHLAQKLIAIALLLLFCGLALAFTSCSAPKVYNHKYAVIHKTDSTFACRLQDVELSYTQRFLGSKLSMTLATDNSIIVIKKAIRNDPHSYSYSGYDTKGVAYDITLGRPKRGDAVIALQDQYKWTIIDQTCNEYAYK
jgi:hypothetical protein